MKGGTFHWIVSFLVSLSLCCSVLKVHALFVSTRGLEINEGRRWEIRPIGKVQGSYVEKNGVPKQPTILEKDTGRQQTANIVLFEEFGECMYDLEGFDFLWVISYMHLNKGYRKKIRTRSRTTGQTKEVGLFSSRAPHRPNALALSALRLSHVDTERRVLTVQGKFLDINKTKTNKNSIFMYKSNADIHWLIWIHLVLNFLSQVLTS